MPSAGEIAKSVKLRYVSPSVHGIWLESASGFQYEHVRFRLIRDRDTPGNSSALGARMR
jgi:hypothetical protein